MISPRPGPMLLREATAAERLVRKSSPVRASVIAIKEKITPYREKKVKTDEKTDSVIGCYKNTMRVS